MAHTIGVTDGTTTITFTKANGYMVTAYEMRTPESASGAIDSLAQAAQLRQAVTVAETMQLSIVGTSTTDVQGKQVALERLLQAIRRRQALQSGPRVYVQMQLDGEAGTWRSELIDARLDPTDEALRQWPNFVIPFTLTILRVGYWEGALTQLPLTNANGSGNTSGLTIYNHDDAGTGHDDYVQIAAADVTGALPSPVMLELTNNTGSARTYTEIFVATNAHNDPANFPHVMEAESTVVGGYGTAGSDAACSNGQYVEKSGNGTWEMRFTLGQTLLQKAAGYPFRVLACFSQTLNAFVRPSIVDSAGLIALARGDEIQIAVTGQDLVDLGMLPLPPGGYSTAWAEQRLALSFRTTSLLTTRIDYFLFMPAYAFRRLTGLSASIANAGKVVDDAIEGRAYALISSVEQPWFVPRGSPVMVWPNTLQRLYFAWSLLDHTAPIAETLSVKAWYRPRRLTF